MDVRISKTYEYIPEWNDNKEEETPIKFYCRLLTSAQIDKCMSIGSEIHFNREKFFLKAVIKIENLTIEGKPVITPENFLKVPGLGSLFTEVTTDILQRNNQEPEKN